MILENKGEIELFFKELQTGHEVKIISNLYLILLSTNPNNTLQIKEKQEAEMNTIMSPETQEEKCGQAHLVTSSNI